MSKETFENADIQNLVIAEEDTEKVKLEAAGEAGEESEGSATAPDQDMVRKRVRKVTKNKILSMKIVSIIAIILGIVTLGFIALVCVALAIESGSMTAAMQFFLGDDPFSAATTASDLFCNLLLLVMGIMGLMLHKRPQIAMPLAWITGLRLVISSFVFIFGTFVTGSEPYSITFLINFLLIGFDAFFLWLVTCFVGQEDHEVVKQEVAKSNLANPKRLGFLRVIEFLFVLNIIFQLTILVLTQRDNAIYTFSTLLDWANVVFECVALWFVLKRFRAARTFVLIYSSFNIIVGATYSLIIGEFSILSQLFDSSFDILLFLYFLTSRRVRLVFTNKMSFSMNKVDKDDFVINRKGWPFVRNLIIYYCVFSLLGHWMEAGFCQLIRLGLVAGEYDPTNTMLWRDWFYPFPMEGAAVVIIALFLYPLKNWLVEKIKIPIVPYAISFCVNGLVCGLIEFSMGLIVNSELQLWNYSDMPFNIMGQVCLQNALGFATVASLIAWFIYPLLERALSHVSKDVMNVVFVVTIAAYAIPQTLYLIDPPEDLNYELTEAEAFLEEEDVGYSDDIPAS